MRGLLLPVACLLLLAPAAAAQDPAAYELTLHAPTITPQSPLEPETGPAEVRIPWTLKCTNPASAAVSAGPSSGSLVWTFEAHPETILVGNTSGSVPLPDCVVRQEATGTSSFGLAVTRNAPGETPLDFSAAAHVSVTGPPAARSTTGETQFRVFAAYVGLVSVKAAERVVQAQDGWANFTFQLANLGNSRSNIAFVVHGEDPLRVHEPAVVALESPNQADSGTRSDVSIPVRTDGVCGEQPFSVTVLHSSTKQPDQQAEAATVALVAVGDDCAGPTGSRDSPPVAGLLPVLAAAGLVLGRRRP